MKLKTLAIAIFFFTAAFTHLFGDEKMTSDNIVKLPDPLLKGSVSLEETLSKRRTARSFSDKPITLEQLSQLFWAAQGINETRFRHRTAPSAGALYPLRVYAFIAEKGVTNLPAGLYRYVPNGHYIKLVKDGDLMQRLSGIGYSQTFFAKAPVCFAISAVYRKTTGKYGKRGIRYVHMEAGHSAQNLYLQGAALKLGVGIAGAFRDDKLSSLMEIREDETPLYLIPVGWRK